MGRPWARPWASGCAHRRSPADLAGTLDAVALVAMTRRRESHRAFAVLLTSAASLGFTAPAQAQSWWVPQGCPEPYWYEDCTGWSDLYEECVVPQLFVPESACVAVLGVDVRGVPWNCEPLSREACRTSISTPEGEQCYGEQLRTERSECNTLLMLDAERLTWFSTVDYRMEPRMSFDPTAGELMPTSGVTGTPETVIEPARPMTDNVSYVDWASFRAIEARYRDPAWGPWAYIETTYASNGDDAETCHEYVYERFFDVTVFADAISMVEEPRQIWDIAYGPASNPAAIGTRHLSDPTLRARPGSSPRSFGEMWPPGAQQARNGFYLADPADQMILSDRLAIFAGAADPVVAQYRAGEGTITPSFVWYRDVMSDLTHPYWGVPRIAPVTPPPGRSTGYTPEELEYLWDLQQRFGDILDQLAALPLDICVPYELPDIGDVINGIRRREISDPPGWDWDISTIPDMRMVHDFASDPANAQFGFHTVEQWDALRGAPMDTYFPYVGMQHQPAPIDIDRTELMYMMSSGLCSPEAVAEVRARKEALLTQALALMREADRWGCFQPGLGPCDVSYSRFATDITEERFEDAEEREYQRCWAHFPAEGWYLPATVTTVWPGDLDADGSVDPGDCGGDPSKILPDSTRPVNSSADAVDLAMGVMDAAASYRDECRAANAREEIRRQAPELVGPDGELRPPGFLYQGAEEMGDRGLFALDYSYRMSFGMDGSVAFSDAGECNAPLAGMANFDAGVTMYNNRIELIHAHASSVRTDAMSLRVYGPGEIFTGSTPSGSAARHLVASRSWDITVASGMIVVVAVPVRFTVGASGTVGFEGGAIVESPGDGSVGCGLREAGVHARPSARIDGFLTAMVEVVIARAGVKGRLTIVQADLPMDLTARVEGAPGARHLIVRADGRLGLSTLSGRVSAFAQVGIGWVSRSGEATLFEWKGPSWDVNLFHHEYELPWSLVQTAY